MYTFHSDLKETAKKSLRTSSRTKSRVDKMFVAAWELQPWKFQLEKTFATFKMSKSWRSSRGKIVRGYVIFQICDRLLVAKKNHRNSDLFKE